jgi:hypothetical protein
MSADERPRIAARQRKAEHARLARLVKAINKHRQALELAIDEGFEGALDPVQWRDAFDSSDPRDAIRTITVTGSYSAAVNAYVELLKASAGSRLLGLLPHRRPHAEQVFKAVAADDGITAKQVAVLNDLYVLEGRIEHASPDVDADEVREAVERLRKELPSLVKSAATWLAGHGVSFE